MFTRSVQGKHTEP